MNSSHQLMVIIVKRQTEETKVCQRNSIRFWDVMFCQTFDPAEENISIYFAGEPGADADCPIREFLTLCMKKCIKWLISFMAMKIIYFFKVNLKFLFIRSLTYYYKLGPLAGFTICNSGRGPEWNLLESNSISEIDGLELKFVLEK